jgi:hypothetical protein
MAIRTEHPPALGKEENLEMVVACNSAEKPPTAFSNLAYLPNHINAQGRESRANLC